MAVTKLADAKEDFDHWLEVRKGYLSSSEVFTWRGKFTKETDWWEDTRDDVIFVKRGGTKEFDAETITSMWHGSYDEENIMRKFGEAAGCAVSPENGFYVNDRWPMLGASIDGWCCPWVDENGELCAPPVPEASHDLRLFPRMHSVINKHGGDILLEIKKSTSVKWQKKCPDYYWTQVQTQLAILECPLAIITAECIKKGKHKKWRMYWDQRAYVIEPDPNWPSVMDQLNEEALDAFG